MGRNNLVGAWGESLAWEYLKKKKYKLAAVNYRTRYGELDLVVYDRKNIVFVEVKTRKSSQFAAAAEFVTYQKQQKLRTTAEIYLSEYPTKLQPRFDVIEVYAPEGVTTTNPKINHLEDAFQ